MEGRKGQGMNTKVAADREWRQKVAKDVKGKSLIADSEGKGRREYSAGVALREHWTPQGMT